jgi:hypothetical protein
MGRTGQTDPLQPFAPDFVSLGGCVLLPQREIREFRAVVACTNPLASA